MTDLIEAGGGLEAKVQIDPFESVLTWNLRVPGVFTHRDRGRLGRLVQSGPDHVVRVVVADRLQDDLGARLPPRRCVGAA